MLMVYLNESVTPLACDLLLAGIHGNPHSPADGAFMHAEHS